MNIEVVDIRQVYDHLMEVYEKATKLAFAKHRDENYEYWQRNSNAGQEWRDSQLLAADYKAACDVAKRLKTKVTFEEVMESLGWDPYKDYHLFWTMGPDYIDQVTNGPQVTNNNRGSAPTAVYQFVGEGVQGLVSNIVRQQGVPTPLRKKSLEKALSSYYNEDIVVVSKVDFDYYNPFLGQDFCQPSNPWMEGRLNIFEVVCLDGEEYPSGRQPRI